MKRIPLGKSGKFALVDDEDYDYLSQFKWYYQNGYAVGRAGEPPIGKIRCQGMHRYIMQAKKGQNIDHKDRDGLNNQKSNLRFATYSQNSMNRPAQYTESGYKGVCWTSGRWVTQVYIRRKVIHRSRHTDLMEAVKTYDEVAKRVFGEFALLNFPDGNYPKPGTYDNYPDWAQKKDEYVRIRDRHRYWTDPEYRKKKIEQVRAYEQRQRELSSKML